jgi:hypothetical protein
MVNASIDKRYGLTMPFTQTLRATFKAAAVVVLVLAPDQYTYHVIRFLAQ